MTKYNLYCNRTIFVKKAFELCCHAYKHSLNVNIVANTKFSTILCALQPVTTLSKSYNKHLIDTLSMTGRRCAIYLYAIPLIHKE